MQSEGMTGVRWPILSLMLEPQHVRYNSPSIHWKMNVEPSHEVVLTLEAASLRTEPKEEHVDCKLEKSLGGKLSDGILGRTNGCISFTLEVLVSTAYTIAA